MARHAPECQVDQSPAEQRLSIGQSQQPGCRLSPLFMGCWVFQQKFGQTISFAESKCTPASSALSFRTQLAFASCTHVRPRRIREIHL